MRGKKTHRLRATSPAGGRYGNLVHTGVFCRSALVTQGEKGPAKGRVLLEGARQCGITIVTSTEGSSDSQRSWSVRASTQTAGAGPLGACNTQSCIRAERRGAVAAAPSHPRKRVRWVP